MTSAAGNPEQRQKPGIGEHDLFPVNEHGVVYRFHQALKQLLAAEEVGAAPLQVFEQFIDRRAQLLQRLRFALQADSAGRAGFEGEPPDLCGEFIDRVFLTPLPNEKRSCAHGENHRGE